MERPVRPFGIWISAIFQSLNGLSIVGGLGDRGLGLAGWWLDI